MVFDSHFEMNNAVSGGAIYSMVFFFLRLFFFLCK